MVTNFSTYSYRRVDVRICTAKAYEKSFLLFWRTKSGFSMAAVRAKCTANEAEPDLRLSCTVTVPMCAKPIAGSAGSFGVHFAFTVDVQTLLASKWSVQLFSPLKTSAVLDIVCKEMKR